LSNILLKTQNVPLHDFCKKSPANPHGYVGDRSKIDFFSSELSNSGGNYVVRMNAFVLGVNIY